MTEGKNFALILWVFEFLLKISKKLVKWPQPEIGTVTLNRPRCEHIVFFSVL